jgi:hypothetical protein
MQATADPYTISNGSRAWKGGHMSSNDQKSQQSAYEHPHPDPEHATEPSGPKGDNPATGGPGPTKVQSNTPENSSGHINPSAPEDANITPGTAGKK